MLSDEEKKSLINRYEELINGDLTQDAENVLEIIPSLVELQNDKGHQYGRSYCKMGDTSIYFNVARKYDRIENIIKRALENGVEKTLHGGDSSTATETFLDTVSDLAVYSLMWAGYIKETHPDEWESFKKSNGLG